MNALKEFAGRVKAIMAAAKSPAPMDAELGAGAGGRRRDSVDTQTTRGHGHGGQPSQYLSDYITPAPGLQQFRLLVGIVQDKSFRASSSIIPGRISSSSTGRPAPNTGVYARVCTAELKCKNNYKNASRLINSCLGLQIVVAAALTALGAADGSRSAITVFGAINTIIAGFLTYLKGSGLPNRLRYYQHEWSIVREYIEQRERDLSCGQAFDVMAEVALIRQMFESVKTDVESSQADRFVGLGQGLRPNQQQAQQSAYPQPVQRLQQQGQQMVFQGKQILTEANQGVRNFHNEAQSSAREVNDLEKGLVSFGKGWFHEKQAEASTAISKAQHGLSDGLTANVAGLKARLEEKMRDIGHLEKELEHQSKAALDEKRADVAGAVQKTIHEAEAIGQEIDSKTRAVLVEGQTSARNVVADSQTRARDTLSQYDHAARGAVQDRSDAARAAIRENELAAQQALARGQAAATEAVSTTADQAAAGIARTEAIARAAAKDYIDRAFDGVSPPSPAAGQGA